MTPHISFYGNVWRPASRQTIAMDDWIAGTASGRWRVPVERARAEYQAHGKSATYKRLKEALPCVTPNGRFSYHSNNNLTQSSASIHGDVDGLSHTVLMQTIDKMVGEGADPLLYYAFISPSVNGIKFGYKTPVIKDDAEYKRRWSAFAHHIKCAYGVDIDPSCKDIARFCYVSYDPNAYYNPDCDVFHEVDDPLQGPEPKPAVIQVKTAVFYALGSTEHPGLDYAVRMIENAAAHTKNNTRIKMGRLVGGLIAGGQLDASAAYTLADVAAASSEHPEQARKDIAKGIAYGKAVPIYPEDKPFTGFTGFKSRYARKGLRHG